MPLPAQSTSFQRPLRGLLTQEHCNERSIMLVAYCSSQVLLCLCSASLPSRCAVLAVLADVLAGVLIGVLCQIAQLWSICEDPLNDFRGGCSRPNWSPPLLCGTEDYCCVGCYLVPHKFDRLHVHSSYQAKEKKSTCMLK